MLSTYLFPLFDLVVFPTFWMPRWFGLTIVSVALGIAIMKVYELTSDQWAMAYHKDKLKKYQFQLLSGTYSWKTLKNLLIHNVRLGIKGFIPAVSCILVLLVLIPWIGNRFGYKPIKPMTPFTIQVSSNTGWSLKDNESIRKSPNQSKYSNNMETIRALSETPGNIPLRFTTSQEDDITISLRSGVNQIPIWPSVTKSRWYHRFAIPAERTIPTRSGINSISIEYPQVLPSFTITIPYLGHLPGWLSWFFLVSFFSGLWIKQRWEIE